MYEIEYTAQAFADMYESLFMSFFETNNDRTKGRYPIPIYFKSHPHKCPAKALIVNVLADVQHPHPNEKNNVKNIIRSYVSRMKWIDLKKLDVIYVKAKDRRLDAYQIEQMKEEILDIINPKYLVAIHLYMKYHKVFHRKLFDAFCGMIITSNTYISQDITSSCCFAILRICEELVYEVMKYIKGTSNKKTRNPKQIYNDVYSDFLRVEEIFPAFKAYKPKMDSLEKAINDVLKDVEENNLWNPSNPKRDKNGKLFPSTVELYLDSLTNMLKRKFIIKLETKSGQSNGNQPNLRTIRSNSSKLTHRFKLAVPFQKEEKYANKLTSCPKFILIELWNCLQKYGLRGKQNEKLKTDNNGLIYDENIILMGRLYMIVLLCYAFDSNNYYRQETFKDIITNSLKDQQVSKLLKTYHVLSKNEADKNIITELFTTISKG